MTSNFVASKFLSLKKLPKQDVVNEIGDTKKMHHVELPSATGFVSSAQDEPVSRMPADLEDPRRLAI